MKELDFCLKVLIFSVTKDPNKSEWLRDLLCQNTNLKNLFSYLHAVNRPSSISLSQNLLSSQIARAPIRQFDEEHAVPVSDVSNGPV